MASNTRKNDRKEDIKMKKKFNIEVDCAACAAKVEDAIRAVDGVDDVSVSFMTQKMSVEADASLFPSIMHECLKAGRKVEPDFTIEF